MPEYPLPSYAASIWVASDSLMLAFPGQGPEARGHTIRLPLSAGGLQAAIAILKDRAQAQDLRLSQRGTPSQYEAEAMLTNDAKYRAWLGAMSATRARAKAEKAEAEAFLAELGL